MRRVLIGTGLVAAALAVIAAGACVTYIYRVYVADLEGVDAILSELPTAEADPPIGFGELLQRIHPDGFVFFVTRKLISELHPQPPRIIDWHLRNLVWTELLPWRLSQREMLALYAHFMSFENGRGLAYGSQHYYGKPPSELSPRQLLELFVIAKNPHHYSPSQNPDRFRAEVNRLSAQIGMPAA